MFDFYHACFFAENEKYFCCKNANIQFTKPSYFLDTGTWVVSNYGMCGPPCVRVDYGEQQRNVSCLTYGGKITHGAFCGAHLKPKENRECPTMQCTTMWKTGMWSEVRNVALLTLCLMCFKKQSIDKELFKFFIFLHLMGHIELS